MTPPHGRPSEITEPWSELLTTGREDERLVHEDRYDGRAGRHVTIPEELNPLVHGALAAAGIETLYAHQAQAVYSAFERATVVTTGTASGKSLCFQLPALQVLTDDHATPARSSCTRPRRWPRTRRAR